MLRDDIEIYSIYYFIGIKEEEFIIENVSNKIEALGKFFLENKNICYNDITKIVCNSWDNKVIYKR